ncbi:transcription termination/antitermination protein NusA [Bifidobacterium aemilianum]|uniref:Transcription termination/antitermination protein NusA n=1 Tax=Bifidobacterium aemilianum TaxID=2493120 RepID=A0A366K894_9BIFI|nr:transcription termination factor NusA [Bifidobacterium aemilianum]RBP97537.1 transcription termination/antitermination protein NusA [Bifidobacterium aemilianum]
MELDLTGIHQLAADQGIDKQTLDDTLSEALRLAYLKTPGAAPTARIELDERAGSFTIWARDEEPVEPTEDNPHPRTRLGEEYDDTPKDFGRLAASTARQVIRDLFRSAEDEKIFGAFSGQKGKLITGVVQQDAKDPANVHVAVGEVEAILPKREQVPGEHYKHGERLRVYVVNVARGLKGPEIVVSRSHPELVRRLFEREVPELVSGAVSIMAIAREAGARTKVAVRANTPGVNPKGSLIGPGGARVRAVMENLGPEKIDIVDWSKEPDSFVAAALSPAVATKVEIVSEKNKTAIALIHDDQLSLAIGKEGQNARLAAKLTGWKIGIESTEAYAAKEAAAAVQSPAAQSAPAEGTGQAANTDGQ